MNAAWLLPAFGLGYLAAWFVFSGRIVEMHRTTAKGLRLLVPMIVVSPERAAHHVRKLANILDDKS